MLEREILELFNVIYVGSNLPYKTDAYISAERGYVLDCYPTPEQKIVLDEYFKPLDMRTLFTLEERNNASIEQLITKQILHYIEVYGLNKPGLFNLEVNSGKIITLNYVKSVDFEELTLKIHDLLYSNAPIKNTSALVQIVNGLKIPFNNSKIKNNEMRILLFDVSKSILNDGDDAVRFICYYATNNAMLIKSTEVLAAVKSKHPPVDFFERHKFILAKIFNRHKAIIMSCKDKYNSTEINNISKLSKSLHVPYVTPASKTFISDALTNADYDYRNLKKMTVRDKFKFLNLLAYKKLQQETDVFVIRNGKLHIEEKRKTFDIADIDRAESFVLHSIDNDLSHLRGKKIILDKFVDYGLPISRKQTLGNLPFGTSISVDGDIICSGIYWEDEWGATDLDLSVVDKDGNRTGWGSFSGYNKNNPITFSGDVTSAYNGAMEFMSSRKKGTETYGLFVNIYAGRLGCKMELVIGSQQDEKWISNPVAREKCSLESKGNIVGFVKDGKFVVFSCRMNASSVSGPRNSASVKRGLSDFWTIGRLFRAINIQYDIDINPEIIYDYDLRYNGFDYSKLEELF